MRHPVGVIHGRFQVLHNDHLVYLLAGKQLCDHMVVGVTNPDDGPPPEESVAPHRSKPENNPLSYDERKVMVETALQERGVPADDFSVIPLPIAEPQRILKVAPADAVYYLTIYDDWGREKLKRLQKLGLTTHVMWERPETEKGISGSDVRALIRSGGDWRELTPPSVARLVERWEIQKRLSGSR